MYIYMVAVGDKEQKDAVISKSDEPLCVLTC